jgi:transglycosylase-like protein
MTIERSMHVTPRPAFELSELGPALTWIRAADVQRVENAAVLIAAAHSADVARVQRPRLRIGTATTITGAGSVNGYPCGGTLPSCCTLEHESHGTPDAQNPTSSSSGLWQFTDDTWAGYGGYQHARQAPAAVQNERAVQVFAGGRGWAAWKGDGCYAGG